MYFHSCAQCHGYHAVEKTNDDMVGTGETAICITCHSKGEEGYITADTIRSHLGNLVAYYDSVIIRLAQVQSNGMNDAEISYLSKDIKHNLIEARTLVHTFDKKKIGAKTSEGIKIAKEAIKLADAEMEEFYGRRTWFTIATAAILVLAVLIFITGSKYRNA